ncbi:MAG: ABC transporter permease [Candidatus Heimdallarchaeota archaeon]|nr:MAG: ABC transporter permease [Candidatus Heimdallarchaeota archaeon]
MLLLRKVIRDLRKNKARSLPIIILISVSQAASILYIEVGVLMDASWQQYFQEGNVGDVWIDTIPISPTVFNQSVLNKWQQIYSIKTIQPRLYFKGHLMVLNKKVPVEIVSLPANNSNSVNSIITKDRSYFTDYSEFNGVYIEQSYLEFHNLENIKEIPLTIDFGTHSKDLNLTLLGGAFSPEYPMKAGEGGSQQQFEFSATFAQYLTMSIFLRTDYLQKELFQGQEIYNQICISLTDKSEINSFIQYLQTDESLLNMYTIDIKKYPALIEDMAFIMIWVGFGVAFFFLLISIFLTYTVVNRFIDEQKPQIGVMKSLGYSNGYLLRRNLFYGVVLGFIGSFFGNLVGGCIGIVIADLALGSWLSLPYIVITLPTKEFLILLCITIMISIFACYVSARRILRISPRAAIQPVILERNITTFILEDIFQKIFQFRLSVPAKYSIRNVFINPKRTLATIISLLMAVALVGGVLTIVASVFEGGSLMFESENWDAQITLTNAQQYSEVKFDILNQIPNHESIILEPMLIDFAKIRESTDNNDIWTKITFTALPLNHSLIILDSLSTGFSSETSVMISSDLAKQLEVDIGDQYTLLGRNGTQQTVDIQIILPQHHVSSFYIPISLGNYLSFGNSTNQMVNGILLAGLASEDEITPLSRNYSVILKSDLIKQTESWYMMMSSILFGVLFLVLIIAGMIIYSIMSISIAERKDDLTIMRSLGIHNKNIYLWGMLEVLIYSLLASVGYFIGFYISAWYMDILQQLMQQPQGVFKLSFTHYLLALSFGFAAATLGQFLALRYVLKQRIALVTKEKMFG